MGEDRQLKGPSKSQDVAAYISARLHEWGLSHVYGGLDVAREKASDCHALCSGSDHFIDVALDQVARCHSR